MRRRVVLGLVVGLLAAVAGAQTKPAATEDFGVYGDGPRLLLRPQRLRLIRRERERESIRWQQFGTLIAGGAAMPEPGFANALHYRATDNEASARKAIAAALRPGAPVREIALVYDWCEPVRSDAESAQMISALRASLSRPPKAGFDVAEWRDRALAAIALGDKLPDRGASVLAELVRRWRETIVPAIKAGHDPIPIEQRYALIEMMHAVRDTTEIDLREGVVSYFKQLPALHLQSHYPAPYPAAENEYRIPLMTRGRDPDLNQAVLSRAAALALVAYDTNLLENQFLQGWLMQDRFLMRGGYGIPYEFLWANPYQPGLSFTHLPLLIYEPQRGVLFARSSWEEDAEWIGFFGPEMQYFGNGKLLPFRPSLKPQRIGAALFLSGEDTTQFKLDEEDPFTLFLLRMKPNQRYDLEIDDEEMIEVRSDAAGILPVSIGANFRGGIRLKLSPGRK
jgi:hypothetical protein